MRKINKRKVYAYCLVMFGLVGGVLLFLYCEFTKGVPGELGVIGGMLGMGTAYAGGKMYDEERQNC